MSHTWSDRAGSFVTNVDECDGELVDNQNLEDIAGNEDRMQRFNAQTQRIQEGLKRTEDMVMPKIDMLDWIKKHPTNVPNADGEEQKEFGLAIAGSKLGSIIQKQVYEVVFTEDDTGEAERIAREKAASARKQQNALPSWHVRSTVTGDIMDFGLNNMDNHDSNGSSSIEARATRLLEDNEDQKNSMLLYYQNLEAEEKASQAQTPMEVDGPAYDEFGLPLPRGVTLAVPTISNAIARTFSVGSLKRKLDLDDDSGSRSKHSRSTSYQFSPPSPLRSKSRDSSTASSTSGTWQASQETTPDGKDPVVLVNGVAISLSQITDVHHELMTPEEYERYAKILMAG